MNNDAGNLTITPYFNCRVLVIQEKINNFDMSLSG